MLHHFIVRLNHEYSCDLLFRSFIVGGAYASLNHLIFDNLMIVEKLYVAGWAWMKSFEKLERFCNLRNMFLAFPPHNVKTEK